jgi:hypothetical protein
MPLRLAPELTRIYGVQDVPVSSLFTHCARDEVGILSLSFETAGLDRQALRHRLPRNGPYELQ